jgi:hypothetical protein
MTEKHEDRDKKEKNRVDPFDTKTYGGEPVVGSEGGGGWSGGGEGHAPDRDASVAEDSPLEDDSDTSAGTS